MFCRSLFVLLSFFFPLCVVCSSLILRILITPLVSSNSSCRRSIWRSNGFFNKKKKHSLHMTFCYKCCSNSRPRFSINTKTQMVYVHELTPIALKKTNCKISMEFLITQSITYISHSQSNIITDTCTSLLSNDQ